MVKDLNVAQELLTKKHGIQIMKESLKKDQQGSNLIKFQKNNIQFILCDCKSEILVIEYDEQLGLADIAIYENRESYSNKISFWQKLRYIYQILIKNKPYADQIVLNKKQIKELRQFLSTIS